MHPNEIAINDYVDETLAAAERTDVERHLAACAECRALVTDLIEIRRTAGSLDLREPPVRAWTRIERAIRLEEAARGEARRTPAEAPDTPGRQVGAVVARLKPSRLRSLLIHRELRRGPAEAPSARSRARYLTHPRYAWLAAAAAITIATLVGLQFRRSPTVVSPRTSAPAETSASASQAAQAVEYELRAAEEHYEKAISGLEAIARSEQNALDPGTAATLQKNLAVIDQAISESRAALKVQPASEPAQQSLMENFKTKIALLQDTVALINEMRKGNEAGAARIVSGLKQKGD